MSELIHNLPWSEYIAGNYLGSSALDAWGKVGIEAWSAEHLESRYDKDKASKYMAAGSALDALLTGDTAGKRIAVKPEGMTFATKDGKAWREANEDAEIITAEQDSEIKAALPLAREALAVLKKVNGGEIHYQVTLRGELSGIPVQTRPDMMLGNALPDLKYVNSQAFARFDRDFLDSRYFIQAGLAFGLGMDVCLEEPSASFLLLESGTVHPRCRVVEIPRRVLQAGWDKARKIADEIAAVKASPLGFVDVVKFGELELPAWAESRI